MIDRGYALINFNCKCHFGPSLLCSIFTTMKIEELTLFSPDPKRLCAFYSETLGMSFLEKEGLPGVNAGWSILLFDEDKASEPVHMAFLLPGNCEQQALNWLMPKVDLLEWEGKPLIDFPNWNAVSQYFYDPDGNIVEFIARRDVEGLPPQKFGAEAVLGIGEVGLPAADPEALYAELNSMTPLPKYSGDFLRFGAAGSPEGLFILVNPEKKTWFPTGDNIRPATLKVRGSHNFYCNKNHIKALT